MPYLKKRALPMLRVSTERGTEYSGKVEQHDYQLYLSINEKTKAMSPQTNGVCERYHKIILNEFYHATSRKKLYDSLDALQKGLDEWVDNYIDERTRHGKTSCSRTPTESLMNGKTT